MASPATAAADELQTKLLMAMQATRPTAYSFERMMVIDKTGSPRRIRVERYDPQVTAHWQLVSVDGHPPPANLAEQLSVAKRGRPPSYAELADWFGAPATRIAAPAGFAIYRFAHLPANSLVIEGRDLSAESQAEALVNLKGVTPYVEQARLLNTRGLRILLVASIKRVELVSRYGPTSASAIVPEASTSILDGSLFGRSGEIKTAISYRDFRPAQ